MSMKLQDLRSDFSEVFHHSMIQKLPCLHWPQAADGLSSAVPGHAALVGRGTS